MWLKYLIWRVEAGTDSTEGKFEFRIYCYFVVRTFLLDHSKNYTEEKKKTFWLRLRLRILKLTFTDCGIVHVFLIIMSRITEPLFKRIRQFWNFTKLSNWKKTLKFEKSSPFHQCKECPVSSQHLWEFNVNPGSLIFLKIQIRGNLRKVHHYFERLGCSYHSGKLWKSRSRRIVLSSERNADRWVDGQLWHSHQISSTDFVKLELMNYSISLKDAFLNICVLFLLKRWRVRLSKQMSQFGREPLQRTTSDFCRIGTKFWTFCTPCLCAW